jgi:hypothetical protein
LRSRAAATSSRDGGLLHFGMVGGIKPALTLVGDFARNRASASKTRLTVARATWSATIKEEFDGAERLGTVEALDEATAMEEGASLPIYLSGPPR